MNLKISGTSIYSVFGRFQNAGEELTLCYELL